MFQKLRDIDVITAGTETLLERLNTLDSERVELFALRRKLEVLIDTYRTEISDQTVVGFFERAAEVFDVLGNGSPSNYLFRYGLDLL